MTKKTVIIQICIALIFLSGCNIKLNPAGSSTSSNNSASDEPQRPEEGTDTGSKPTKPAKTEAEKNALAKTCSEISDEATCNKNTDCKFYIVCMPADKALEIENDKELKAQLEEAEKKANLEVYKKLESPATRIINRNLSSSSGEYLLKFEYEKLEKQLQKVLALPFGMIHDQTNFGFELLTKRNNALNDLISKMKENDKKDREANEKREKLEREKLAEINRKAEEQKNLEKREEEERERRAREQRAKEQAERDLKRKEDDRIWKEQNKLRQEKEAREEQERNNQKKAADEIKNFIEKNIFERFANKNSLNKNILLLNAEQKQQLIQKVKKLNNSNILENFSSNLLTSITPSQYSLELFEALVNNEDFKKYYAKNAYVSIRFNVNHSINEMVNEQNNNDYKKDLIIAILKNPIFNDLKFANSLDNNSIDYSKLLDIMETSEDRKIIYDYMGKSVNENTIKHVLYKITNNKKEIFNNLEALYKNDFVKNNFDKFTYSIKELLGSVSNNFYMKNDKLNIVNLMLKNYLAGGDLFTDSAYPHEGSISKYRLKNVLSATKDDQAELINYIKSKSNEKEKQKLIELVKENAYYHSADFSTYDREQLKQILTAAGIIKQ